MQRSTLATILVVSLALACGDGAPDPQPSQAPPATTSHDEAAGAPAPQADEQPPEDVAVGQTSEAVPVSTAAARRPDHERPLPGFGGVTVDGQKITVSSLLGKRFLLFMFNPEVDVAQPAAEAVVAISKLRGRHNFEILGIATGSRNAEVKGFVEKLGMDFPVIDDSSARIAGLLRAPYPIVMASVDAEGYVVFTTGFREHMEVTRDMVGAGLRKALRLPVEAGDTFPALGFRPLAPDVKGTDLNGKLFQLSAQRGRAVVLVFFLHTCPHCHHALGSLTKSLGDLPKTTRPKLVAISVMDRASSVRARMERDGLVSFPILMDPGRKFADAYGLTGGVPELVLIDPEGRIAYRSNGWRDDRDPPIWRMRLAQISGEKPPMLLHRTGYSGNEFCAVCHEKETVTWEFTKHAGAFGTLVKHGADRDAECVSCHVVGFEQTGGYALSEPSGHLEDVGCETCHGRGGPHQSPGFVKDKAYENVCESCHDQKHSLGFEFAKFAPKISHAAQAGVHDLSMEERLALLEQLGRPKKALMPSKADFVGSDACQECHAAEYATWASGGHARAGATLVAKDKASDASCLTCHTTGFDRPGGFPAGSAAGSHPDLGRVGCESCHGAGGEHVKKDVAKIGSIVSLGDKCDSCVILQICGECHDAENDPGFEFNVQERIEQQRHGTSEPGTGKPKGTQAWLHAPTTAVVGTLEGAFAGPSVTQ